MIQFRAEIRDRIREAMTALEQATVQDDEYLVTVHTGELESLVRLAHDHGLQIPEVDAHLAAQPPAAQPPAAS